jgi:hypothetical protein
MTTTLTLLSAATLAATSHAEMLAINGTVTIIVSGQPAGAGLLVSLFGAADFAAQNSASAITINNPGTYTLTAVNAAGIRAALLAQPSSPVTLTASF